MRSAAAPGRALIGIVFLISGIQKLVDPNGTVAYAESAGLPLAGIAVWLAIALEIAAGAALVAGFMARWAAAALLIFVMIASFYFHAFWALEGEAARTQTMMFLKNMMIIGGLLVILGLGAGPFSIDGDD